MLIFYSRSQLSGVLPVIFLNAVVFLAPQFDGKAPTKLGGPATLLITVETFLSAMRYISPLHLYLRGFDD